ncbi:hypothetical protein GN958_ATG20477 [Phytophthora infestans]|uniref:Crinkler (CRN) family protein n=1 Tax=Phytophthora infestans TaxID=4787 RepID=A0A8S9TQU8_PHYIN|nr:hypothetical protein GN958_ATG20477 [Phytophthora infestans]
MRRVVWFHVVNREGEEKAGPTKAYDLPADSCVDRLRYVVKAQCPNATACCDAANLRVYKDTTSRRNKQPLHPSTLLADIEGETTLIVELPPPDQPLFEQRGVIRKRFEEWFASDMLISTPKRIKLDDAEEDIDDDDDDDDDDHVSSDNSARADTEAKDQDEVAFAQQIRYFDMADFPPLVSSADRFKRVMVREAYDVIFNGVVEHVQHCLENQCAGRVVVTGNPGVSKSRFFLYCAFQLIKAQLEVVRSLPPFELVLNCEECYFLYEADKQAFGYLEEKEIVKLSFQKKCTPTYRRKLHQVE